MCLILQGTRFQVQVLNPCKSVQKSSEIVLDFKTRQLVSIKGLKSCFSPILNSCSTDRISIKVYKNQFFKSNFTPIRE